MIRVEKEVNPPLSKRRYRSTEIKAVNTEKLLEALEDRAVVAVDIAKTDMFAAVLDASAEVHAIVHWGSPISKILPKALAAAGVDRRVTVHGLRHTANDLLRRAADDEIVRAIIGHSTQQMTRHYSHIEDSETADAARRVLRLIRKGGPKGVVDMELPAPIDDPKKRNPARPRGSLSN